MANSITPLPPVPLRSDTPANFVTKADAFLGALNVFATETNAVGLALTLGATNATSTTSLTVGAGSKSLTVETAKSYVPGMSVKIASTASPSNWMLGDVTSYTTGTGALVVNVTDASGSGTFTAWTTSQSSPGAITTSAQQAQLYTAFTTGGTSAAFTLTPIPAITSLIANQRFRVKFNAASTGTPTLAINGLTAANLQQYDATGTLVTATLGLNQLTDVEYNGSVFVVLDPLTPVIVAVLPGTIIAFASATVPAGYMACPQAATTVSRATYAALFAAIGTTWGAGDGTTTFGIPFFAADQVPVQQWGGAGTVGTTTVGVVISHDHTSRNTVFAGSSGSGAVGYARYANGASANTNLTGGVNNLPAGSRVQYCVKY